MRGAEFKAKKKELLAKIKLCEVLMSRRGEKIKVCKRCRLKKTKLSSNNIKIKTTLIFGY